jgi:hypothetical protein
MNQDREEEIAASVGAHRNLGPGYDDAIATGLVERIGAEIDRRVDERVSQHQRGGGPPAVPVSWQQVILALGAMAIGGITSASINTAHGDGTWPIIFIWIAIVVINAAIFRASRQSRRDRRPPG